MIVLVEGKPAMLKSGSSFEFIAENRLFMGRDSYTLNMTFPLRGCPQNRAIFGYIERVDVAKEKLFYECEIRDRAFSASGSILVTGVTESEVTCQFAEGRCEQSATDPFEETYINDLELGKPLINKASDITPLEAWSVGSWSPEVEAVALPWVNEAYPTPPNNDAAYLPDENTFKWADDTKWLSWQPYLLHIARKICQEIGYACDFSQWEQSDYRYLIVCNTLPATWDVPEYARALPHWSVSEFFEKLELFLMGEFEIDHRARTVNFAFSKNVISQIRPVKIDRVVETYSSEISSDDSPSCEYIGAKRLAYKECSHKMWNYYSCDWFFNGRRIREYADVAEMISRNGRQELTDRTGHKYVVYGDDNALEDRPGGEYPGQRPGAAAELLYAKSEDTYFIFRSIAVDLVERYTGIGGFGIARFCQRYVLQPVNQFGSGRPDSDNEDTVEIEFVPPCIMETDDDHGDMMFLSFSNYDEVNDGGGRSLDERAETALANNPPPVTQPYSTQQLEDGEKSEQSEYYDTIYVGFWNGTMPVSSKMPYPLIDKVTVSQDWKFKRTPFANMRLTDPARNIASQIPKADPRQKFKFSWISSTIPNPRAIFHIMGRKFLCEKITATFTEDGMSQLLKGEFYPLLDN